MTSNLKYCFYSLRQLDSKISSKLNGDSLWKKFIQFNTRFPQGVFIFKNAMPQSGGYAIAIFKKIIKFSGQILSNFYQISLKLSRMNDFDIY